MRIPLRTHLVLFVCTAVQTITERGQFVDALKTSINISGLVFRGLHATNCKDDNIALLDDLHSSFGATHASPFNPSTNHGRANSDDVPRIFHVLEQEQQGIVLMYVLVTWKFVSGVC
jgi:hypothetical protein